jgi:hypothetical protein
MPPSSGSKWVGFVSGLLYRLAVFQTYRRGRQLVLVCVNRNNEHGTVTMSSFSISTEPL